MRNKHVLKAIRDELRFFFAVRVVTAIYRAPGAFQKPDVDIADHVFR